MKPIEIVLLCGIGIAVFFAVKHVVKQTRRCKQVGCSSCRRAGHCIHQKKRKS